MSADTVLTFSGLMRASPPHALEVLHEEMRKHGYVVFDEGDYNLNLIGVRRLPGKVDAFDDVLFCTFKANGGWCLESWPITTDPGLYYLQHPMRVEGTGILCPGQYRGCWTLGYHKGEYEALVQRKEGVFRCWRDRNRDGTPDRIGEVYTDAVGVNCHHAGSQSTQVGRWSMLCQVHAQRIAFDDMMALCHQQAQRHGNVFSYTLLELGG